MNKENCIKCGWPIRKGARWCARCGRKLRGLDGIERGVLGVILSVLFGMLIWWLKH